ncbi:MAG TPA: fibronectin type III domain-containing protein, partial [Solirubrobacterales bacterium]
MRREAGELQLKVIRRAGLIAVVTATAISLMALGASAAPAAPPKIVSAAFSHVTSDSVVLEAEINPEGKAVSYHFEYGSSDCFSSPCTTSPALEGALLSKGTSPEAVSPATLEGLTPGTTYHFRVAAKNNSSETAEGSDTVFVTYPLPSVFEACPNEAFRRERPSTLLPDCRAYEQASPMDKNGADVNGGANQVQASTDGNSVSFFSAAGLPGAVGAQDFETYLARRGAGDWLTRGVYPPASDGPIARNAGWTPDLSLFFSNVADSFGGPWTFRARSSAAESSAPISSGAVTGSFLVGTSA